VSGEIARSLRPLNRGLTIGLAIRSNFESDHSVAPSARLHDGIASPTIVGTAILFHENAFCSHLYGLTNHDNLPPFSLSLFFQLIKIIEVYLFYKQAQKKELPTFGNSFWSLTKRTIFNLIHSPALVKKISLKKCLFQPAFIIAPSTHCFQV
jgi:hypothetical protein